MPEREPYLSIQQTGETASGRELYQVTKKTPQRGIHPAQARILLCKDLGAEAIGSYKAREGGCDRTEFTNDTDDLTCAYCGNEFSKYYLRQQLVCEIRGLPP